jgi:peptide/nickel transport system substrate-binding protein
MRFNPTSRSGRLWRLTGLMVVLAAIAAVIVSATGASAKNDGKTVVGHAAVATVKSRSVDGTLLAGTLPKNGTAASGGTLVAGQLSGQTPTDIDPIINGATCSTDTFQFVADMYVPLYYGPSGATPAIDESHSAALPPKYSDGNKTVTITIKPGLKWSDGTPVNAEDVAFYYYVLKAAVDSKDGGSPANWCQYTSSTDFPFNVKSISYSGNTVVMHLTHSVNSTWFTYNQLQDTNGGVYPLPATDWDVNSKGQKLTDWATNPKDAYAIYSNLNNTNGADSPSQFATSPLWKVVDGGFKLQSFNTTNDSFVMSPNASYGFSPKPNFTFKDNTYTDSTALLDAMESGSVEVGQLDPATQLGSVPTLNRDGFSVFGAPQWGWWGPFLNYKDKTNDFDKVVAQPYIRGVFGQLVNQKALIAGAYHGYAVPAYGPVASAPKSPYVSTSAVHAGWHFNPKAAEATLKAHGWNVKPGGTTTCAKPGTGAKECGAGIPAGTPIKFVWATQPESAAAAGVLEAEAFETEAKQLGIDVSLQFKPFSFLTSNYNDTNPAAKKYYNDWGANGYGGVFTDYYPTEEGVINTTGALNMGGYNDPTANSLMLKSTNSVNSSSISNEVNYFAKNEPVLFMPIQDWVMAVSNKVGGTTNGFLQMTQQQLVASLLWVNK